MKIAIAQINTTIGDFEGNADKIAGMWQRADEAGAALILLPELALCGYPPRDLLAKAAVDAGEEFRRVLALPPAQVATGAAGSPGSR